MLCNGMVQVARGAKWDLGFDMVGAHAARRMDCACAKTELDFVDGGTDILRALDLILVKTELCLRMILEFI